MKIKFLQALSFLVLSLAAATVNAQVVINEFMASNITAVRDEFSQFDDWIELHNRGTAAVNIGGWHLTDTATNIAKWTFPINTTIAAGGYLIVWADEDSSQNSAGKYHANFKLSKSGETLRLSNAAQALQDNVSFGVQTDDRSYSRIPNGTGNFIIKAHTFGINNQSATPISEREPTPSVLRLSPNPAQGFVRIELEGALYPQAILVFNSLGQVVFQSSSQTGLTVPTEAWAAGLYVVRCGGLRRKLVVQH